MHIHVHRPTICVVCKAEMAESPDIAGWFRCITCGARRDWR